MWPSNVALVVLLVVGVVSAGCDQPCQTRAAKPQPGRCVPVAKCPSIKQHLLRLQFRAADQFEAFLSERACSYGKDGVSIGRRDVGVPVLNPLTSVSAV